MEAKVHRQFFLSSFGGSAFSCLYAKTYQVSGDRGPVWQQKQSHAGFLERGLVGDNREGGSLGKVASLLQSGCVVGKTWPTSGLCGTASATHTVAAVVERVLGFTMIENTIACGKGRRRRARFPMC